MDVPQNRTSQEAGQTAIITGASAGLGESYARQLAERGFNLVLVARREDRLQTIGEELKERFGIAVEVLPADLSVPESVGRLVSMIQTREDIEILVNNAGFGVQGPFHTADIEKHVAMIHVHVLATVRLTHAVLPQMVARHRGYVINVSSLASFLTAPGAVSYCATKSYLNTFSKSVQAELQGTGVRIQALCPGFTYTEFHDVPDAKMDRSLIPRFMWMSADRVVSISLGAMSRRRVICVPGLVNRVLSVILRSRVLQPFMHHAYGRRLKGG